MPGAPRRRRPNTNASSHRLLSLLALLSLILAPHAAGAASVRSVAVVPSPVEIRIGQAVQLRAYAIFNDDSVQEITQIAEWSSGDKGVAIVSSTPGSIGIVTAVGPGSVRISAAITIDDDRTRGSADVTVIAPPLAAITTKPTTKRLEVGLDRQYKATAVYVNEFTADVTSEVTWTSTNPSVATVDDSGPTKGLVHPIQIGTTEIIARDPATGTTSNDGFTEVRGAIVNLSVDPEEAVLGRRMRFPMRCYGNRADGSRTNLTEDVDWGSTNPSVARVGTGAVDGGVVRTRAKNGTATIHCVDPTRNLSTVTSGGGATVTVAGRIQGLEVRSLALAVGEEKGAHAFGVFRNGSQTSDLADVVVWSIEGPPVATVGNTSADQGDVVGIARGTATLRAEEPSTGLTSTELDNLKVLGAIESVAMEIGDGLVGRGEEVEYKARATYQGGDTSNVSDKCSWSSDASRIATVGDVSPDKGIVRGVRTGTTTIRAVCSGFEISGPIEVIGGLVGLAVTPATFEKEALSIKKFHAVGIYDDGKERDLTKVVSWVSSNPDVVAIDDEDERGLAMLLKPGSATITATHPTAGFMASATVVVEPGILSMEIVPPERTIRGSVLARFRAQGRRADGSIKVVTKRAEWSSDDPEIVRVSNRDGEKGTVFGGGKEGTTLIRATLPGGFAATARVTIEGLLARFELVPESRTIPLLQARILTARGFFTDGSSTAITRGVVYTSSDDNVVIVSNEPKSQGLMTAVGRGSARITAFDPSSGKSADNPVFVTVP
jgi:uncharacterized protein YjdB